MSTTSANDIVGLPNPKPNYEIDHTPLDWKKLRSMSRDQRDERIVERANYIAQCDLMGETFHGTIISMDFSTDGYKFRRGGEGRNTTCPNQILEMPYE